MASRLETACDVLAGAVLAVVLGTLCCLGLGCAAEVESDSEEIGLQTEALTNGCYNHLSIKSTGPGMIYSPYSSGRVWDYYAEYQGHCFYKSAGYDYLYSSQTYPGNCGQYDARTWYCSGAGVVTCPGTASLARPNGASDNPFGPYTAFNRNFQSYGSEVQMPFTHSYFDNGTKRVVCGYRTDNAVYRYGK